MIATWGAVSALWTGVAWAAPVDQRFQVGHRVDFADVEVVLGGGDDFFVTNTAFAARFAFVKLYDETTSHSLVDSGFTDEDGFITFDNINSTHMFTLELHSSHNVDDRPLNIVDQVAGSGFTALSQSFAPTSTLFVINTKNIVFRADDTGQEWINAAAVASWMMFRRPGAFPTFTENGAYSIIMDDPSNCSNPVASDAVYCFQDLAAYLDPTTTDGNSKYVIAHEFMHELQHWALVPDDTENPQDWMYRSNYDATSDANGCATGDSGSHDVTTFEYQSAAIVEGMAHYGAAVAFNVTGDADCRFQPNTTVTWDPGQGSGPYEFSCEGWDPIAMEGDDGGFEWLESIPGGDYFHWDSPTDPGGMMPPYVACSENTHIDNRGIEVDWLRFFWDEDNKEGLDMADIMEAWIATTPAGDPSLFINEWNAGDTGLSGDDPRPRLEEAFGNLDFGDAWDGQAVYNGVTQ